MTETVVPEGSLVADTLRITLLWSPRFAKGARYARHIVRAFDSLGMVRERKHVGVPVRVRCAALDGATPRPIDWSSADVHLVVYFVEDNLLDDITGPFRDLHASVCAAASAHAPRVVVLPVAVFKGMHLPGLGEIEAEPLWDYRSGHYRTTLKDGSPNKPMRRLLLAMLGVAIRVLRQHAAALGHQDEPNGLVPVFMSHANRSAGRRLVEDIAKRLEEVRAQRAGVVAFLDSDDLPSGGKYRDAFDDKIKKGMFVAVHTDGYSTRPYCRWEMVRAKWHRRPILVVQMLRTGENRSFPYSGNTPLTVVSIPNPVQPEPQRGFLRRLFPSSSRSATGDDAARLSDARLQTIDTLLLSIMSETLRFLLFECEAEQAAKRVGTSPAAILCRPPELADLARLMEELDPENPPASPADAIVYPDPPLDDVEIRMVDGLSAPYVAMTLSQFASGKPRARGSVRANAQARFDAPPLVTLSASDVDVSELVALGFQPMQRIADIASDELEDGESNLVEREVIDDAASVLWQAAAELVTATAELGARLGYGGNLQPGSITRRLFDEVADAYYVLDAGVRRPFVHFLALSVWRDRQTAQDVFDHVMQLGTRGEVQLFFEDGSALQLRAAGSEIKSTAAGGRAADFERTYTSAAELHSEVYANVPFDSSGLAAGLTQMRRSMAQQEQVRFLVGGSLAGVGRYPGVLEEAIESIDAGRLVVPLAAFGGAAHEAAVALGLLDAPLRDPFDFWTLDPTETAKTPANPRLQDAVQALHRRRQAYADTVAAHGVEWADLRQIAHSDSAAGIAEGCRRILNRVL